MVAPLNELELVAPAAAPGAAEAIPPAQQAGLGAVAYCALALLSLGLTAWGIREQLPVRHDMVVGAKLAGWRSQAETFDTVFVGSSLAYRHVDPALFDEIMTGAGHPSRSFNLGAPGMGLLEMSWLLEQLTEARPVGLRWVFVDPHGLGLELPTANRESARAIAWHSAALTAQALGLVWESGFEGDRRDELLGNHLVSAFFHEGNVGAGRLLLEEWLLGTGAERSAELAEEQAARRRALGPAANGFFSLDDALLSAQGSERKQLLNRQRKFREDTDRYTQSVAAAVARSAAGARALAPVAPGKERLLRDLARQVDELGAKLVFFSAPSPGGVELLAAARELQVGAGWLDLTDPRAYPELFALDQRFDTRHLTGEGAARYTAALAQAWLAALEIGETEVPGAADSPGEERR